MSSMTIAEFHDILENWMIAEFHDIIENWMILTNKYQKNSHIKIGGVTTEVVR